MIRTLRKKFILVNMLLVFIVLGTVFCLLLIAAQRQSWGQVEITLQRAVEHREPLWPTVETFDIDGKRAPARASVSLVPVFVVQVEADGTAQVAYTENIEVEEAQVSVVAQAALAEAAPAGYLHDYSLRYQVREDWEGTRIAFADVYQQEASMRYVALAVLVLLAVTMGAFFVISLFLSRWALRPVEKAWEQQRRFVADASHELKTPLTVILANTGILLENRGDTIEQQAKWVENTEAEAVRMKQLVDSLLFLAKTDDAKATLSLQQVGLSDLVAGMALTFEALAFERGILLDTEAVGQGVQVMGDAGQLRQMLGVLVDNAIKYSDPGGTVRLSLSARQGKAVLAVQNWGVGLGEDEMAHLFERFYRADESRAQEGYGLGLAIAKSVAESHGGRISATSGAGDGTVFTVTLPLA